MSFTQLTATSKLRELAKKPIDLTKELTADRVEAMITQSLGLKLFYGTERVTEPVLQTLFQLAQETKVLQKMAAMQAGEIMNTGENRAVLHTAMRDFFDQQNQAPAARQASDLAKQELDKLKKFLPKLDKFTDCIQIGIGGSSLGPEAIYLGLEVYSKRRVHFLSNVDPDEATKILRKVNLYKTVVIVVSKSGSTLETLTNETLVRDKFEKAGLNSKEHFIAVTGKGSPMDDPKKYLASFHIWDYVGGRYSVTSMVGAVALCFAFGMDHFHDFLRGASAMDKVALSSDPKMNLPLFSALIGIWNRNFLNYPTIAVIPYSQALSRFPAHLQQLDMESNGKRVDKEGKPVNFETGPIIWGEPGTNGQHSFFQLIHQGTTVVPLEIIGFIENQYGSDLNVQGTVSQEKLLSNLFAQSIALAQGQNNDNPNKVFPGNRPTRILLAQKLDAYTMGAILAYYEHKVAFQGFIWNVNSFDQEGVQLGKVLASKLIEQFAAKRKKTPFAANPLGQAYLKNLTF